MTIHPDHQYKGAGTQLMQWGLKVAEGMNAPVLDSSAVRSLSLPLTTYVREQMTVESSIPGRHLYEKHGFQVLQDVELPVPEKWADKSKVICFFMHRLQSSEA